MLEDTLQLCPKCRKGRMRPTGRAGTKGEEEDPFREIIYARNYICNNCSHHMSDAKNTEYAVEVSNNVPASVDKVNNIDER
jgi:C4-type Zn-finger protein